MRRVQHIFQHMCSHMNCLYHPMVRLEVRPYLVGMLCNLYLHHHKIHLYGLCQKRPIHGHYLFFFFLCYHYSGLRLIDLIEILLLFYYDLSVAVCHLLMLLSKPGLWNVNVCTILVLFWSCYLLCQQTYLSIVLI